MPNGVYTNERFWNLGYKLFPEVEEILVLGGEPFIQKDTYRLISEVQKVNKKCRWGFVTNGQFKVNDKFLSTLDPIDIRFIQVSLDSIDPKNYRAIRKKGELEAALESLQRFLFYAEDRRQQNRPFTVSVAFAVQKRNWHEIESFYWFAKNLGLEIGLQFVSHPEKESLLSFSNEKRAQIARQLIEIKEKLKWEPLQSVISQLEVQL
ncbi:unnamed protein product [Sphagnum jensenii]